jgi:hypothetical protein
MNLRPLPFALLGFGVPGLVTLLLWKLGAMAPGGWVVLDLQLTSFAGGLLLLVVRRLS